MGGNKLPHGFKGGFTPFDGFLNHINNFHQISSLCPIQRFEKLETTEIEEIVGNDCVVDLLFAIAPVLMLCLISNQVNPFLLTT